MALVLPFSLLLTHLGVVEVGATAVIGGPVVLVFITKDCR